MGRGLSSDLADTTKPGCIVLLLYMAKNVKTILNFVDNNKYSSP